MAIEQQQLVVQIMSIGTDTANNNKMKWGKTRLLNVVQTLPGKKTSEQNELYHQCFGEVTV